MAHHPLSLVLVEAEEHRRQYHSFLSSSRLSPPPPIVDTSACVTIAKRVKSSLASFFFASNSNTGANLGPLLELYAAVLRCDFCPQSHAALGNIDYMFKSLSALLSWLLTASGGEENLTLLQSNISLLCEIIAGEEECKAEFAQFCAEAVKLWERVSTGKSPASWDCFEACPRITLKRVEMDANLRHCIPLLLHALAQVPTIVLGHIPCFLRALELICTSLRRAMTANSALLSRTARAIAVELPNSHYRLVEAWLEALQYADAATPPASLREACDYLDFLLLRALPSGEVNADLLALHCSAPTLALLRTLNNATSSSARGELLRVVLDFATKLVGHRPQIRDALMDIPLPIWDEKSAQVSCLLHKSLAQLILACFPRQTLDALFLEFRARMDAHEPYNKQPRIVSQWSQFLVQSDSFCATLLRIQVFSDREWVFRECVLKALKQSGEEQQPVCLLQIAAKEFNTNDGQFAQELWEVALPKLESLFQRAAASGIAVADLVHLLVAIKPATCKLPTSLLALLPSPPTSGVDAYVHVDNGMMETTLTCLQTLTARIVSSQDDGLSLHVKRIVDQIPETSDLASTLLPSWDTIIFSSTFGLATRLCLVEAFASIVARCNAPTSSSTSTSSRQYVDSFFKRGIIHDDLHVRAAIAQQFGVLLKFGVSPNRHLQKTDLLISFIPVLSTFLEDEDLRAKRRHILIAIGSIGCATTTNLLDPIATDALQWALSTLASQWTAVDSSNKASLLERTTAREELCRIASVHGLEVRALFEHVGRQELLPVLFHNLLASGKPKLALDRFTLEVFDEADADRSVKTLIRFFPVLLPFYLNSRKEEHLRTLKQIACITYDKTEFEPKLLTNLLYTYVKEWIVPYMDAVINGKENREVFKLCKIGFPEFLRGGEKKLLETYVLQLATLDNDAVNPRAMRVLERLAMDCHTAQCEECERRQTGQPAADCRSVEFLVRNKFMFMFFSLSQAIQDKSTSVHSLGAKKRALRCVSRLLLLLGESNCADDFIPRVLPTLADALQDVELQNEACSALKTLAYKLSKPALEQNMLGFVVAMLPCFQHNVFSNVATELILGLLRGEHKFAHSTLCQVQEILPTTTQDALGVVAEELTRLIGKRELWDRLELLSQLLDRDSDEVSLLALTQLETILTVGGGGREIMQDILLSPLAPPPAAHQDVISGLFQSVLKVARSAGTRIRNSSSSNNAKTQQHNDSFLKTRSLCLKCCNCIGLLGAVDPARLTLEKSTLLHCGIGSTSSSSSTAYDTRLLGELSNKNLAIALLGDYLIEALNTAPDSDTHMHVGYVIQEIVQHLGQGNIPPRFDSTVRLFLKTNYALTDSCAESQYVALFFHNSPSFASSIGKWVTHLCSKSLIPAVKPLWVLKDSNSSCVTRMMLFVLPYAVQNVLYTGEEEDEQAILKEIQGILRASNGSSGGADVDDARDQLSVQAVFQLLDTLENWTRAAASSSRAGGGTRARSNFQGEFADKTKVANFLQSIRKIDLAEAAFRVGSYSRAQFYLETHVRATYAATRNGGGVGGPGSWRMEECIALNQHELELFHKICAASMEQDPDGLKGVTALRTRQGGTPSLIEQIRELESEAKWNDALKCYEEAIERAELEGDLGEDLHEGQLRCLWRAGNLDLVVNVVDGKSSQNSQLRSLALPYSLDALWRLGKWPQLKLALEAADATSSSTPLRKGAPGGISGVYCESVARAMLCAVEKGDFKPEVERAQLEILGQLSAASMESYGRGYPLIVRLQALVELEAGLATAALPPDEKLLQQRLQITSMDSSLREELLAVRRSVHRITSQAQNVVAFETESWLSLAKMARKFGDVTVCHSALSMLRRTLQSIDARSGNLVLKQVSLLEAKIQQAKLFKANGDLYNASLALEPCSELLQFAQDCPAELANARAKALLLHTKIVMETGVLQGKGVLDRFNSILSWNAHMQQAQVQMAKYQDYLMERMQNGDGKQRSTSSALLPEVLRTYGRCLTRGDKSYFEILPRMLTLWFTNAERDRKHASATSNANASASNESASKKAKPTPTRSKSFNSATSTTSTTSALLPAPPPPQGIAYSAADAVMRELKDSLPIKTWYSALAQLVSHICNPSPAVWSITKDVLVLILSHYPSKALWSVVGVFESRMESRKRRAEELLNAFNHAGVFVQQSPSSAPRRSRTASNRYANVSITVFRAFTNLALCKEDNCTAKAFFQDVQAFTSPGSQPSQQQQPVQQERQHYGLVLPTQANLREEETNPVLFESVGDGPVEVMKSKEKPKKIRLRGTDGKSYNFLCKREERGDLRKDARLMEFNAVVNALFMRDAQAQRRRLRVRTYNVVCLNEVCGLLEWVENTMGFKSQIGEIYAGEVIAGVKAPAQVVLNARHQLEALQRECAAPNGGGGPAVLKQRYMDEVLPLLPPCFHKWFLRHFPDQADWVQAKTQFTRSCAVWSMMGYILGLGDRHAENLLLDMKSGECIHVDFDCLFDKGLTLNCPEIVPFRLTRNLVDGMGISGVEGMYRGTCEVTLHVLRSNKDMLLSVLESFVVDPLVDWSNKRVSSKAAGSATAVADAAANNNSSQEAKAKAKFDAVAERLAGVVRDREATVQKMRHANRLVRTKSSETGAAAATTAGGNEADFASVSFDHLQLSIAGQVDRLITEAIDEGKLCKMFGRFLPFEALFVRARNKD